MLRAMRAAAASEVEMWKAAAGAVSSFFTPPPPSAQMVLAGGCADGYAQSAAHFRPEQCDLDGAEAGPGPGPGPAGDVCEWDGLVFAVPKRRTSRSVKRMRMSGKWLKPMENIVDCNRCGSSRLAHNLCLKCVNRAQRRARTARRAAALDASDDDTDSTL
eukprot:m.382506 g.382506  ORF g.382506 m.382506 type:complete len:160 (+) comp28257_c0_seq29:484-963(+)